MSSRLDNLVFTLKDLKTEFGVFKQLDTKNILGQTGEINLFNKPAAPKFIQNLRDSNS